MKTILSIPVPRQGIVSKANARLTMKSPHCHNELEFNLVLRGNAGYLLENRRYSLGPDTVVWLFPSQEHILLECSNDFEMWVVVFRPELLRQICLVPPYQILLEGNPPGYFCKRISSTQTDQMDQLLSKLNAADDDKRSLIPAWPTH
jgi:hypothetical protein